MENIKKGQVEILKLKNKVVENKKLSGCFKSRMERTEKKESVNLKIEY